MLARQAQLNAALDLDKAEQQVAEPDDVGDVPEGFVAGVEHERTA